MTQEETLLTFPCAFPIKVIGDNHPGFAQTIADLVRIHFPDYDPAEMELRPSSGNKYLALTVTVTAESKAQLDALYRVLSAHPTVRAVL